MLHRFWREARDNINLWNSYFWWNDTYLLFFDKLKITRKIFLTVQIFLTGNWKLLETIHTNIDLIFFNYFIFDNSDKSHREIFRFVKKNILFMKIK